MDFSLFTPEEVKDIYRKCRYPELQIEILAGNCDCSIQEMREFLKDIRPEVTKRFDRPMRRQDVDDETIYQMHQSGLTYKEIGARIGMARRTVAYHVMKWKKIKEENE